MMEKATFGAGCFWGVQAAFDDVKGVVKSTVGFMGGKVKDPSYEDVSYRDTGHAEVVQVEFDPAVVSYEQLLEIFWKVHDPTQMNRQGPDIGDQYRSAIFYHSEEQRKKAMASKKKIAESGKYAGRQVVTEIVQSSEFYPAEEYHQKYLEKRGKKVCH